MATTEATKDGATIVSAELRWQLVDRESVPDGRKGRHHRLVGELMEDLRRLGSGSALRVPVADFAGESVAKVRAALNRATRKAGWHVATRSDNEFFYAWIEQ
jgi:hypothetical protein